MRWHKYRAKPHWYLDGQLIEAKPEYRDRFKDAGAIWFGSKKEAERYKQLKYLEAAGEIKDLKRQVPFKLQIEVKYIADFTYSDKKRGQIVEDTKGFKTAEYKKKKKHLLEQYPEINFIES